MKNKWIIMLTTDYKSKKYKQRSTYLYVLNANTKNSYYVPAVTNSNKIGTATLATVHVTKNNKKIISSLRSNHPVYSTFTPIFSSLNKTPRQPGNTQQSHPHNTTPKMSTV